MNKPYFTRLAMTSIGTISVTVLGATTPALAGSTGTVTTVTRGGLTPVTAVKLTSAQAISIVEKTIPQVQKLPGNPQASLGTDPLDSSRMVYNVDWSPMAIQRPNGPMLSLNPGVYVRIDANTGQILSFQGTTNDWIPSAPTQLSKSLQIARGWLRTLLPTEAAQMKLAPTPDARSGQTTYIFMKKQHGAWVSFDQAIVVLGAHNRLVYYSLNWKNVTFPAFPASVMPPAQAMAKYRQSLNLQLQYQPEISQGMMGPYQLVYRNQVAGSVAYSSTPAIDAVTGAVVGSNGSTARSPSSSSPTVTNPLVPGGPIQWPKATKSGFIADQLSAMIRKWFGLGSAWAVQSITPGQNHGGPFNNHPMLQFQWVNSSTQQQMSVNMDATDGVMTSFYSYQNGPSGGSGSSAATTLRTQAQLHQSADKFIERIFPQLTGGIGPETGKMTYGAPQGQSYFNYAFLVHGIPIGGITVQVDKITGMVTNYSLNIDPSATYPSPNQAISKSEAIQTFIQHNPIILAYVLPEVQGSEKTGLPVPKFGSTPLLVYTGDSSPFSPGWLNAISGKWVEPSAPWLGEGTTSNGSTPLATATAELKQHGVIQPYDFITNPSKTISRVQFIQWLARAYNYNISSQPAPQFSDVSPNVVYAAEVSEAISQGWLPDKGKLSPEQPLTRAQVAQWLVEWMGWQGPTSNPGLFKVTFSDANKVPKTYLGAVAIVAEDHIIPLQNGRFNPNGTMTVGDAAQALYRAIQTLLTVQR